MLKEATAEELRMQREETADLIRRRFALEADVAERIVKLAKSPDQAYALAELLR